MESPGVIIGRANLAAVRIYFANHIGCTNAECAKAIGLSVMAVGRHVATLRSEWRPTSGGSSDDTREHEGGHPGQGQSRG